MKSTIAWAMAATICVSGVATAGETTRPEGAKVYFVELEDGDIVKSPVKVVFGLSGMGIAPAGTEAENTGHHHLLIDHPAIGQGPDGADEFNYAIGADENNVHFGKGQTETMLELAPGKHTLQLVLGDLGHEPHANPVMSDMITITVE